MTELDDNVIEEVTKRGEQLLSYEFVKLVERYHEIEGPGIPRDLVDAYFERFEEQMELDVAGLEEGFEEHRTDQRSYAGSDVIYEVGDGRVSGYPRTWHERLDEDDSLAAYVGVMTESMSDTPRSASSPGVAKDDLLNAAAAMSDRSREQAREELEDLRAEDVLVAGADQHPRAGVSLADDVDFEKEEWDKPDWGDRSTE